MAVIMAPRRNNDYSINIGGLLTSLIGNQIGAMFERAEKAKQVEAERAVVGALNGGQGMTTEQMLQVALSHPSAGKVGADFFKNFNLWAAERGKNLGKQEYTEGMVGSGFTPEQAKTVTGGSEFLDATNLVQTQMRSMPQFVSNTVDTGGAQQFFQTNPYAPGIVEGTTKDFAKTVNPDSALDAEVKREGHASNERVANISANAHRFSASQGRRSQLVPIKLPNGKISWVEPQAGLEVDGAMLGRGGSSGSGANDILAQIASLQEIAEKARESGSPGAEGMAMALDNQAAGLIRQLMGPEQSQQPQESQNLNREAVIANMVAGGATPEAAAAMYDEMQNKKN